MSDVAPVEAPVATPDTKVTPDVTSVQEKRFKVKVDGVEQEVDEATLVRGYQKASAAEKKMMDAAGVRKQAEQFLKELHENPKELLRKLGPTARAAVEDYLYEEIQFEGLSDEQKRLKKYEEQEKEWKAKEESEKEAKVEAEKQQLMSKYQKQWTDQFHKILETSGLPKTEGTVVRIAQRMHALLKAGVKDVTPEDVVQDVVEEMESWAAAHFGADDGDLLEKRLPTLAEKIRKRDIAKFKQNSLPSQAPRISEVREPAEKKKMTMAEFRKFNKGS